MMWAYFCMSHHMTLWTFFVLGPTWCALGYGGTDVMRIELEIVLNGPGRGASELYHVNSGYHFEGMNESIVPEPGTTCKGPWRWIVASRATEFHHCNCLVLMRANLIHEIHAQCRIERPPSRAENSRRSGPELSKSLAMPSWGIPSRRHYLSNIA